MPHDIILTDPKHEPLLISRKERTIIIIELSCLNDKSLAYWRKEKRDKYARLKGWVVYRLKCHIYLEVSSSGYVLASSFFEVCDLLGIASSRRKALRHILSKAALRCSYVIFINRFNKKIYIRYSVPSDIALRFLFSNVSNRSMADNPGLIPRNLEQITQALPIIHLTHSKQVRVISHSPPKLESSRLILKAWTQSGTYDPSSALLRIKFGERSTATPLPPKLFREAMVKLSTGGPRFLGRHFARFFS